MEHSFFGMCLEISFENVLTFLFHCFYRFWLSGTAFQTSMLFPRVELQH
jgi:hypothetical protein